MNARKSIRSSLQPVLFGDLIPQGPSCRGDKRMKGESPALSHQLPLWLSGEDKSARQVSVSSIILITNDLLFSAVEVNIIRLCKH
jgi:hypothetical protein